MYLLTERPLSAEALTWEELPDIHLRVITNARLKVPQKVRKLSQGPIYYIHSSEGCGCGFESRANIYPEQYNDLEMQEDMRRNINEWRANMQGLERLLRRVAKEQPTFQICTGWDFEVDVQPRQIRLDEVAVQEFDEEWDWLMVSSEQP